MQLNPSTELALKAFEKAFEADAALSAALAEFQAQPPAGTIIQEAQRAAACGFSWFARPSVPGPWEVILRHKAGAENNAKGASITALLAGLLGHPLAQDIAVLVAAQTAESEQADAAIDAVEAAAGALLAVPAESLAAFTGGAVVTEPSEYVPDLEEAEQQRLARPLTANQQKACVGMMKVLKPEQRRLFTIAFRDAFRVPREEKAIAPLITEVRHMEFCDRWSIEAGGGAAA